MAIDDTDARLYIGSARNASRLEVLTIPPSKVPRSPSTPCACGRSTDASSRSRDGIDEETCGTTRSGRTIDDDLVDERVETAERGYDGDEIIRRRGARPPIGSGPATVESVRLDPELRRALAERAEHDQESTSAVIRKALRNYLKAG